MKIVEFLIGWLTSTFLERAASNSSHPIIVYAGLGDSVLGDNMKDFMATLAERYETDVYGINIADSEQEDRRLSGVSARLISDVIVLICHSSQTQTIMLE